MQAKTNDARYAPGVDMIAELHTLRARVAALEHEKEALKRERDIMAGLWMSSLDELSRVKKEAREERLSEAMLNEAARRMGIGDDARLRGAERPGLQPRRRGWVRGWL